MLDRNLAAEQDKCWGRQFGAAHFFRVLKKAFDRTDQIGIAYAVTRYSAWPTWAHLPLQFISVVVFMITYHFYVLAQK